MDKFLKRNVVPKRVQSLPDEAQYIDEETEVGSTSSLWEQPIDELNEGTRASSESNDEGDAEENYRVNPTPRVNKLTGPNDISQIISEGPCQPRLTAFPQTSFGEKKRGFNKDWYSMYPWIEYSSETDSIFCYACRHFPTANKPAEPSFTKDGVRNWRHAIGKDGKLSKHVRSQSHKASMETWAEYTLREKSGYRIEKLLNDAHSKLVADNRHYVKAIVKVLRLTASQKIAQRGHRECESSPNRGNFLETMNLLADYDTVIRMKLNGAKNATYTHPSIQNEIIGIMAKTVRVKIKEDVEAAGFFSLQVDETKDISKKEIISFVVRYFLDGKVHEEFLHFKEAVGLDAESLFKVIRKTLADTHIDIQQCVGQCYDGAAVMSGVNAGVQAKFREVVPQAIYTHCFAHRLNLTLVDCLRSVNMASEFLAVLQKLYVFLSGSYTHQVFLRKQRERTTNMQPRELKRLSDTRWACQYAACLTLSETLPSVITTLEELSEDANKDRAVDAKGLLAVIDSKFVVGLVTLCLLLRKTKTLSDQLQAKELNVAEAIHLVDVVVADLEDIRASGESWDTLWEQATAKCDENQIEKSASKQRPRSRKRKIPSHMRDDVVMTPVGHRDEMTDSDEFRVHFFYPIVDNLLTELRRRFSPTTCAVIRGVSALSPANDVFLQEDTLKEMAKHYGCVAEDLKCELHQAKKLLERKARVGITVSSIVDLAKLMLPYSDAFFELYKLICISLTLSVSSAGCERSFSCLKIQKNYLRNTSGEQRTSDLGVLAINSHRTTSLDLDEIVDKFASSHSNRRMTLI